MVSLDDEALTVPSRETQADALEVGDLATAMGRLPEAQRAVLLLVALEEMSYADIAATLGLPLGTVMSRLSRGRERLRALLDAPTGTAKGPEQRTADLRVVK